MTDHKLSVQKSVGPFNWLEWQDQEAKNLPRAKDWFGQYELFMLARYSQLQPQAIPNDLSEIVPEAGEKAVAKLLADSEVSIAQNTETAPCLHGLDAEQRRQLAALMCDILSELETRPAIDGTARWASQLRKIAEARINALNKKVEKATRAIEELRSYALDLDGGDIRDDALHTAKTQLGFPYLNAANRSLCALNPKFFPTALEQIESVKANEKSVGIETYGMVRLYWFFRHGCGKTGDDAEVRTGMLRNAFWTKVGSDPVPLRRVYRGAESQGCGAVHSAVIRFHQ